MQFIANRSLKRKHTLLLLLCTVTLRSFCYVSVSLHGELQYLCFCWVKKKGFITLYSSVKHFNLFCSLLFILHVFRTCIFTCLLACIEFFYSLFGFLSSSVSAEIFAVFLSLLQVFWYMLCFWNGSACLCLHSCMCFALTPHYTDVHMLYIHVDCWYNITVMMTRGVGLYTVFHITALQSCFCCTLCVTVILHLTFTFLIIHEGKHATKWELMHNTGLFREAACMPSGFKKKPVMIDARLAVETAIVY